MKEMLGAVEYQVLAAEQLLQTEYHIHIFWVKVESGIIIKIITSVICLTQKTLLSKLMAKVVTGWINIMIIYTHLK